MSTALPPWAAGTRALAFDFGNTLIEYGPVQMKRQFRALQNVLEDRLGPCDTEQLKELRIQQVTAPYRNDCRDNDMEEVAAELVQVLYDRPASPEDIEALVEVRYRVFVDSIAVDPAVPMLLDRLATQYRLALLSNYPCGRAIRDSLRAIDLFDRFESVVVSGDVGWVKPHPEPFRVMVEALNLPPEQVLFVGDNWLADIQGAKRAGMKAVLITEHLPYETFHPEAGDFEPDARIERLSELEQLLDAG